MTCARCERLERALRKIADYGCSQYQLVGAVCAGCPACDAAAALAAEPEPVTKSGQNSSQEREVVDEPSEVIYQQHKALARERGMTCECDVCLRCGGKGVRG
jgi:hypothetical protein